MMNEGVLPELPAGWVWTRLEEVCLYPQYGWTTSAKTEGALYLLRTTDITSGNIDWNTVPFCKEEPSEKEKYLGKDAPSRAKQKVKYGDVLFSTVRTYLKNIAQVPSIYDGQIASTVFSILRHSKGVNENFLFYYVQTGKFLNPLKDIQRSTSYPAVRDGDVREKKFPLPPPPEQRRIVAEVERRLSVCDKMELEKARNAPDWEPAEKLLERIKAEKMSIKTTNKDKK
jgi:type I restriction enzyme S subunit